jgi:ABC-2 type transport system ATP-binding protein
LFDDIYSLQVRDIHKSFGGRTVLAGVEVSVMAGELVGIIGENGAGKTTLLRILAGVLRPDRGDVLHRGTIGYCPQGLVLNSDLTVHQHLRFFQQAYQVENLDRADELIDRLGYGEFRSTRAGELSAGTKQKLNLTLALMHDPNVLLMDEPYQGFDWQNYLNFWSIAENLRDRGCSLLVISHIAHDVERFDVLYKLRSGRLVPARSAEPDRSPTPEQSKGGLL